jgi:hypothetical protein
MKNITKSSCGKKGCCSNAVVEGVVNTKTMPKCKLARKASGVSAAKNLNSFVVGIANEDSLI